jgi:hypothetical protein
MAEQDGHILNRNAAAQKGLFAKDCRHICGLPFPAASSKSFRNERCQSATADFRRPFPLQKKYSPKGLNGLNIRS